jgi:hypothetical protein
MGLFTTLIYNAFNDEPDFVHVQKQRMAFIREKVIDKIEDDDFDPATFKSTASDIQDADAHKKLKRVKEFVYKKPSRSQGSFKWFRSNFVRELPKNRPKKDSELAPAPVVRYPRSEDPATWPIPLDAARMPKRSNTVVLASGLEDAFGDLEDTRFL